MIKMEKLKLFFAWSLCRYERRMHKKAKWHNIHRKCPKLQFNVTGKQKQTCLKNRNPRFSVLFFEGLDLWPIFAICTTTEKHFEILRFDQIKSRIYSKALYVNQWLARWSMKVRLKIKSFSFRFVQTHTHT